MFMIHCDTNIRSIMTDTPRYNMEGIAHEDKNK